MIARIGRGFWAACSLHSYEGAMTISKNRGALAVGLALLLVGCGSSLPAGEGATGGTTGGNVGAGGAICRQVAPDGAVYSVCSDASAEGGAGGKKATGGTGGDSGPFDAKPDLPTPPVGAE